jgi:hypothetical protein
MMQGVHEKLKPGLQWLKLHSTRRLFTSKLDLELRKKLLKCYIWSIALYGAETWNLQKLDQKYLESFEMCWRRIEKISWTDRINNEAVLHSKGGKEHSSHNKTKEDQLDWAHTCIV